MSKGFKTVALIFVLILLTIMTYNIFSGANNTNVNPSLLSDDEESPFYVSILISWLPMMVIIVFYILFLRSFKQIIRVGERIAPALETNVDKPLSNVEDK